MTFTVTYCLRQYAHSRLRIFRSFCIFLAGTAFAIPVNHVPDTAEGLRPFMPAATNANHLLVVNAGGIPPEDWPVVSTYALSRLCLNAWTNSVEAGWLDGLTASTNAVPARFGKRAKVAVFICDKPGAPREVASVGAWCVENVSGFAYGATSRQTVRDRWAKAILRAVARVGGAMETAKPECSFYAGVVTPEDMDKTRIMLVPEAYFPALARFRAVGGHEMTVPQQLWTNEAKR